MAKHEIETQWMGKMQFNVLINDHTIVMDAPQRSGGEETGPIPKPFVLAALSGCTGMDIVALLRKSNHHVDDFSMTVTGELSKHSPIEYIAMHIVYTFKADKSVEEAVLDVVTDSQEKYCGVSNILKKALPVTWEINFNGAQIYTNKSIEATV